MTFSALFFVFCSFYLSDWFDNYGRGIAWIWLTNIFVYCQLKGNAKCRKKKRKAKKASTNSGDLTENETLDELKLLIAIEERRRIWKAKVAKELHWPVACRKIIPGDGSQPSATIASRTWRFSSKISGDWWIFLVDGDSFSVVLEIITRHIFLKLPRLELLALERAFLAVGWWWFIVYLPLFELFVCWSKPCCDGDLSSALKRL